MNALRLAIGTLTIFPTEPPTVVDRRVAREAMTLAPLVSVLLFAPLWILSDLVEDHWSPIVVAVMWVGGLALLTRALHLDGLADTADGLGSGKPAEEAMAIMRKSDVGPFGVVTLALVLFAQVAAVAQLLSSDPDAAGLVAAAVVWSRVALPWACLSRAARTDGLGSMVAGSVTWPYALSSTGIGVLVVCGVYFLSGADFESVMAGVAGVVVGQVFCSWCVRRLGGTTGDVLGACVEVAFTAALLAMCWN